MQNSIIDPSPPDTDGLTWRPLTRNDLPGLVDLVQACYRSDGGLHFLFETGEIANRFFPEQFAAAISALNARGQLVACDSVSLSGDSSASRVISVGCVHLDMRGKGLGTYLMRWSQVQAATLVASAVADQHLLRIATESLTQPAHRLYQAHGFESIFEELVMRRDLRQPLPDQSLPDGVTLTEWQPALADQFFQVYHAAFRERPGFPGFSASEWIAHVTENDHVPAWSLLARRAAQPLGFVIGNADLTNHPTAGYVWQIGVVPSARRRCIASALLVETMRRMQSAGAPWTELTVHTNNPGAIQSYARLGFETVGRRARYERTLSG